MNQIIVIMSYRHADTWVFDDEDVALDKDPFACGIPAIIDYLTRDIRNAEDGFRMLFSVQPFPGFQEKRPTTIHVKNDRRAVTSLNPQRSVDGCSLLAYANSSQPLARTVGLRRSL